MYEIPVFPVHAVLFPGATLNLYIFEDRYKQMVRNCLEARQLFGVALIHRGEEALGPLPEPHQVGCTAQITHVQYLPQGRMNIAVQGLNRFRIVKLSNGAQPYLIGRMDPYPLINPNPAGLRLPASELRGYITRYMRLLLESGASQYNLAELPEEPVALAYTSLALLRISLQQKQQLLVVERASDLLEDLIELCRREVVLVKPMIRDVYAEQGSFSLN